MDRWTELRWLRRAIAVPAAARKNAVDDRNIKMLDKVLSRLTDNY